MQRTMRPIPSKAYESFIFRGIPTFKLSETFKPKPKDPQRPDHILWMSDRRKQMNISACA